MLLIVQLTPTTTAETPSTRKSSTYSEILLPSTPLPESVVDCS